MVVLLGYVDTTRNAELTPDILYFIPVIVASWYAGLWPGIFAAILAAASCLVSRHFSGYRQSFPAVFWWNAVTVQVFLLVTSILIAKLRAAHERLLRQKLEIEAANEKLRAMDRQKDEFLAICGHDIRGPLAGIIASKQLLLMEIHGPLNAAQRAIVERNLRNARGIVKLTGDLLDMARIEAGQEALNIERVNLLDIVNECIASQSSRGGGSVRCDVQAGPGNLELDADRMKLARICNNLLSNAIKHSPADGVVRIKIERSTDRIAISVADDGPGIATENVKGLFDKFSGLSRHAQTREEGTGLGLSITRGLVSLHGGTIDVVSQPGHGATFTVTIPVTTPYRKPGKIVEDGGEKVKVPIAASS